MRLFHERIISSQVCQKCKSRSNLTYVAEDDKVNGVVDCWIVRPDPLDLSLFWGCPRKSVQDGNPLVTSCSCSYPWCLLGSHNSLQVQHNFFCANLTFWMFSRVATFNDCEDASKELQRQIGEAR